MDGDSKGKNCFRIAMEGQEGHIIWIGAAIIVVFIFQLIIFISTLSKLHVFRRVFSNHDGDYSVIKKEDSDEITGIESSHKNKIFSSIIRSINNYLVSNSQSTADFHLIKDMVERDCESAEDEIDSQVPMPLYCGLMGTMFGILIGVGYLVGTGALAQLIGEPGNGTGAFARFIEEQGNAAGSSGVDGIQALLGGVALAMVTSIIGILFTTIGSYITKDAKRQVETNKNTFLSWMQAKSLPELSTDTASALNKLTRNLKSFNQTFSQNTQTLKETLQTVNETTQGQAELLETVRHLDITRIATANIDVYEKLKNASVEIGRFGEYVNNINAYIEKVQILSSKLDDADERTRMIEEMAAFFKQERANLDTMKALIAKTIGEADDKLSQVVTDFKKSATDQFSNLTTHTATQQEKFKSAVDAQGETMLKAIEDQKTVVETALQKRIDDLNKLSSELEQLKPVKESMGKLEAAAQEQNKKLDKLTQAILKLAETKSGIMAGSTVVGPIPERKPKWPIIVACTAVVICCIVVIIKVLI